MRMRFIVAAIIGLVGSAMLMWGQTAPKQPKPKSQKEVEALQKMFGAQDPDSRIAAAEALLTNFADTEFKPIALYFEAMSYQQKGDWEKSIVFGERVLAADPQNYATMLMLAQTIAAHTREFDLDREEKLARVEKYANGALGILKTVPKPRPDITDVQWESARKDMEAQAYDALGMGALVRKKYDVAITEFKTAVNTAADPDPVTMARLGGAYNEAGKPDDAIIYLNKVLATPNLNPAVRQFAERERANSSRLKMKAARGASGTATTSTPKPPAAAAPPAPADTKKP